MSLNATVKGDEASDKEEKIQRVISSKSFFSKNIAHQLIDYGGVIALRAFVTILRFIPIRFQERLFELLVRLIVWFKPKYRSTAMRNIQQVFPDRPVEWCEAFYDRTHLGFARFVVDLLRIPYLSPQWMLTHVSFPFHDHFKEILKDNPGKGVLFLTGHLGPFDLLPRMANAFGYPISVIARDLPHKRINEYWTKIRSVKGVEVYSRSGALRKVVKDLKTGRNIGIVFDQNVTRNHAIFSNFFGRPAATTFAPAFAAINSQCPVLVCAIRRISRKEYCIETIELDLKDLYNDTSKSDEEKMQVITQKMNDAFSELLLRQPENWFWMHRRWKTTPQGVTENFYR